ncbi:MAG: CRTAC1 family protein, partial [Nitrososphaerota archaeon]
ILIEGKVSAPFSSTPAKVTREELENPSRRAQIVSAFAAGPCPIDYDGDGDMDLLNVTASGISLYRNDSGKLSDVTEKLLPKLAGDFSGAVAADYDNDFRADLLLFGYKTLKLLKNTQDGFIDVTEESRLPANPHWTLAAAFADLDHDGDTDIYLGNFVDLDRWPGGEQVAFPDGLNGQPNLALRNNGNGTFTDITEASGLSGSRGRTVAIIPVDFNNRRDIDIIVINYNSAAQLFNNERTGVFRDVATEAGLKFSGATYGAAAGDLNKDGYIDLCVPLITGSTQLYLSSGSGSFKQSTLDWSQKAYAAQILDYDNDGLLDLLVIAHNSINMARNVGNELLDASTAAGLTETLTHSRTLTIVDLDGDGGLDLISGDGKGGLVWHHNQGAAQMNWARLDLKGRVSNRSGVGARVEVRSGSLKQRLEAFAASPAPASPELHFGLGSRKALDAVRIVWPAGIIQPERGIAINRDSSIQELDRKGTSCPLLYVWNGEKYEFVTDLLGGCAIGYLEAPGHFNYPDTDEYVLVRGEQIRADGDRYRISLNNQLEEVIFFDEVKLLAIDHPADTEVYPNERLMPAPPYPDFKVWTVKDPRPPAAAWGTHGQDVLEVVSKEDRVYLEDFALLPFKGYAQLHTLTLDLGDSSSERLLLLLTAWIDYADSTSNLAASQAGVKLIAPYLQALNREGKWQTIVDSIGFPAGLPKTMTVDLTGRLPQGCRQIRIVTNMRIYWDRVLIDRSSGVPVNITRLSPVKAELGWYGFPKEYRPQGRPPIAYDYTEVEQESPWKAHTGNYTRYGDVLPLLLESEDFYVITRSGDRIEIEFDASSLPPLAQGWRRDFLVYADGFGKDMDLNSARPDTVDPLPFHRMSSYPYPDSESYPNSSDYKEYMEKYNTRPVRRQR